MEGGTAAAVGPRNTEGRIYLILYKHTQTLKKKRGAECDD